MCDSKDIATQSSEYLTAKAPKGEWRVEHREEADQLLITETKTGFRYGLIDLLIAKRDYAGSIMCDPSGKPLCKEACFGDIKSDLDNCIREWDVSKV